MKINNKRESQNIAMNHSADIDYKDFVKIYRECTKNRVFFLFFFCLTIHHTTLASDPPRFRKYLFHSYTNDSNLSAYKITDKNIKANQA